MRTEMRRFSTFSMSGGGNVHFGYKVFVFVLSCFMRLVSLMSIYRRAKFGVLYIDQ